MAEYLSKPCKFFGNPEIDIIDESNPVHFCFMISDTCEFGFYIAPIEFDINVNESVTEIETQDNDSVDEQANELHDTNSDIEQADELHDTDSE